MKISDFELPRTTATAGKLTRGESGRGAASGQSYSSVMGKRYNEVGI